MNWKFLLDQANRQAQPEIKKPFNHRAINEDPKFFAWERGMLVNIHGLFYIL